MLLATLSAGDLLGEMEVVDRSTRTATAIASADCVLMIIDSEQIDARMESSDPVLRNPLQGQRNHYRSSPTLLPSRRETWEGRKKVRP